MKTKNKFKKEVIFHPGFDKRNSDPKKNYGIGAVQIRFVLSGEKGAVQFLLFTDWYPANIQKELRGMEYDLSFRLKPFAADLGYHSYTKMYDEQEPQAESCEFLGGKPCYYDGSTSRAEPLVEILINEGSEKVWDELEEYYNDVFESSY